MKLILHNMVLAVSMVLFVSCAATKEISIDEVVNGIDGYRGKVLSFRGKPLSDTQVGAENLIIVVKPGYWIMAKLKKPLEKALDKGTEISFEGAISGKSQLGHFSAQNEPLGGAEIVSMEEVGLK